MWSLCCKYFCEIIFVINFMFFWFVLYVLIILLMIRISVGFFNGIDLDLDFRFFFMVVIVSFLLLLGIISVFKGVYNVSFILDVLYFFGILLLGVKFIV